MKILAGPHPRLRLDLLRPPCPRQAVADFKTHITGSTIVGVAYGYWGMADQGMSIESALIAGGLCSVSGMLPDLDSDSGIPLRETTMFLAALVPTLLIDRFRAMGLSTEAMAVAAMLIYLGIRFVVVEVFKRYTVHRGMWHSIPAAASAGLIAYLVCPSTSEGVRVYKSMAVVTGFLVHLILDEIWSIDFKRGRFRLKRSFGTALKFFDNDLWPNISVYAKLILLIYLAWGDYGALEKLKERVPLERIYVAESPPESLPWDEYLPWR